MKVSDSDWNPTVPPSRNRPDGEKGRRIEVRWDLNVGPTNPDTVVLLPTSARLNPSVARRTISQIDAKTFDRIAKAMRDENNWVGLQGRFDYEKSLSDFIATYPHRLEDDLIPHPDQKVREKVFNDKTRSDVLLIDKIGVPVIVECKQGAPTLENIKQLENYMAHIRKATGKKPRGILVHGGSASLRNEVKQAMKSKPLLKIVRYSLHVDFGPCA